MGDSKLRIKFGEHEFEAEGPVDAVQDQFKLFSKLVAPNSEAERPAAAAIEQPAVPPLQKIMQVRKKIAWLKVPARPEDAVLVVLLGQKQFRSNDKVSGVEIMRGLRQSGLRVPRADYILMKHNANGHVTWSGEGRGRRYSLTDAGVVRAQQIVRELAR